MLKIDFRHENIKKIFLTKTTGVKSLDMRYVISPSGHLQSVRSNNASVAKYGHALWVTCSDRGFYREIVKI